MISDRASLPTAPTKSGASSTQPRATATFAATAILRQRTTESEVDRWRRHYLRSLAIFRHAGIQPAPDVEQGASRYIELRTEWAHKINVLAQFMLYPTDDWNVTRAIVKRAEAAGSPVLVLTVDLQGGSNRETLERSRRVDTRACATCHTPGVAGRTKRHPMYDDLDISKVTTLQASDVTWDFMKRLRDTTTMKLMIKGIVTRDDAQLAVERGVDGVIVSNHGGRAEESSRSTFECLPEVVEGAAGRMAVLVDGGFRRGTDIFKALALGANAVCVGRPYLWGLAAFGQPGVETVLQILRRELQLVMRQAGTTSIDKITRAYVIKT